jgi:hypothetical protein
MKKILLLVLLSALIQQAAYATSIDWSGTYRFEWIDISKAALGTDPATQNSGSKSYGLQFLTLRPRILASDGISVYSRFDLLQNESSTYAANSQIGQQWGGSEYGTAAAGNAGVNNTTRENQVTSAVQVREMYLKVEEENGALIIGRAPYEFGLGISHNAGLGLYDHWYDTKDMLAYKFFVGNVSFSPMLARSYDKGPQNGGFNQEQLFEIMYDNKDAGAKLGVLFERRSADLAVTGNAVNANWNTILCNGAATCTATGGMKYERTNFFLGRQWEDFGFQVEGGFQKAKTGVYANGTQVEMDGYGIAAELKYKKADSKVGYNLNFGMASGDNPGSTKYEAYQFDRNYDVAMLMFNHRLGQKDFLNTNLIKDSNLNAGNSFDDEAISNVGYLSFKINHDWKERWKLGYTITTGQLLTKLTSGSDMAKDLGIELDAEVVYFPREKVQWLNQIGLLMPGKAFKNGTGAGGDLGSGTSFGFASKAAISF